MKNIVFVIKNLPDEVAKDCFYDAFKELGMDIKEGQPLELDWSQASSHEKERTIGAIVTLQTNYLYSWITKLPKRERDAVMHKIITSAVNRDLFGGFNKN